MSAASIYLLDTNIISHMMREPQGLAAQRISTMASIEADVRLVTSVVVESELLFGLQKRSNPQWRQRLEATMSCLEILPLGSEVSACYALLRYSLEQQGQSIGPNDLLIAAHAMSLQATLVSADLAFARVPQLSLENWLI
ncbi:MAG: hypothetical protein RLZ89_1552 [Pseudomonadota bacterium]|jgi:tRNA(fMet)-specific endonuclease VapC